VLPWAIRWAVVGSVCLVQAWTQRDSLAYALEIAAWIIWTSLYVLAWTGGVVPWAWVGASIYLTLAGFVAVLAGW
jgi:hypothetical protein